MISILSPNKVPVCTLVGEVWCSHLQCLNAPSSSLCSRAEKDPKFSDIERSSDAYKAETSRSMEKH